MTLELEVQLERLTRISSVARQRFLERFRVAFYNRISIASRKSAPPAERLVPPSPTVSREVTKQPVSGKGTEQPEVAREVSAEGDPGVGLVGRLRVFFERSFRLIWFRRPR